MVQRLNRSREAGFWAASALAVAAANPAFAQQAAAAGDTSDTVGIQDITVTAQRREESIQRVPIAITAFSSSQLEQLGVQRPIDLVRQVPNLSVVTVFGDGQQPFFSIRGVGLTSFSDSFEPPVALYVDDVYKGSGVGQSQQLFDIERIEVLRGPQGTLFGRNATAGVFNIAIRRPTADPSYQASVQYGTNNDLIADAGVGGPLTDGVRARVAGQYRYREGWSHGLDGRDYDSVRSYAVRGQMEADLGADATARLVASYGHSQGATPGFGITGYIDPVDGSQCSVARIYTGDCIAPSIGGLSGNDLGGFRPGRTPGQTAASSGFQPRQEVEVLSLSGTVNARLGNVDLVSVTAFDRTKKYYFEDLVIFSDGFTLDARQFSQELRLSGESGNLRWTVGGFYFHDDKGMGAFDPSPTFGFSTDGTQITESIAGFGQVTLAATDTIQLTAGGRYTDERKRLDYTTTFGLDEQRSIHNGRFTWRLGADWQATPQTLVYGSVSTGFKSGGFNAQFVFTPEGVNPVAPERLMSYEAGIKTDLFDRHLRLNLSAFHYDYKNFQTGVYLQLPSGGFATLLRNAGDVEIYGAEADVTIRPFGGLSLTGGVGLLHTRLKDGFLSDTPDGPVNVLGNRKTTAPAVSLNGVARYEFSGSVGRAWLQADARWQSRQYFSLENTERESSPAYAIVGARAGLSLSDNADVEIFVENLFNKRHLLFIADQSSDLGAFTWGRPRWGGASLRFRF